MNIEFLATASGVAWRIDEHESWEDWFDVLDDVCKAARRLPKVYKVAWDDACQRGRGPDAIASADGWRWVANSEDVERAIRMLDLRS